MPDNQALKYRTTLECAPLVTEGFTSNLVVENTSVVRYHYGEFFTLNASSTYNFTYETESVGAQYFEDYLHGVIPVYNYKLA